MTLDGQTTHEIVFGRGLADGVYFLRVQGDAFQTTRKFVRVR